jgi:hypothetical protein
VQGFILGGQYLPSALTTLIFEISIKTFHRHHGNSAIALQYISIVGDFDDKCRHHAEIRPIT